MLADSASYGLNTTFPPQTVLTPQGLELEENYKMFVI